MQCPVCGSENIDGVDLCRRCRVDLTDVIGLKEANEIELALLHRPLRDIAPRDYVAVSLDASVGDVIRQMDTQGHCCALVVDKGRIAGIFTERDVLYKLADRFPDVCDSPVHEFMTRDPETLEADNPVAFALNRMMLGGYRHIPIEEGGKPIGVVSVRNVLSFLLQRIDTPVPPGA